MTLKFIIRKFFLSLGIPQDKSNSNYLCCNMNKINIFFKNDFIDY